MKEETNKKVMEETEKFIKSTVEQGVQPANIDSLYKAIDVIKDVTNLEEKKPKEEEDNMRYRAYGRNSYGNDNYRETSGDYGDGSYGRRGRDSRGRFTARGYDAKYRGEDMIDGMYRGYQEYSEGREQFGGKEETMKSLEYMLESVACFLEMLKHDAKSQEEFDLIKKYTRKISEM